MLQACAGLNHINVDQGRGQLGGGGGRAENVTVKVLDVAHGQAPHGLSWPVRVVSEFEDEFNRPLLKRLGVEGSASEERLPLQTLEAVQAAGWVLAQELDS